MANSKLTGISHITGKTVYIRHANDWDMIMLAQYLNRDMKNAINRSRAEIVVAVEEELIIGFGILQKGDDGTGCITIKEMRNSNRMGTYIIRHLMEYASMKTVYLASDQPDDLSKIGFTKLRHSPKYSKDDGRSICQGGI